MPIRTKPVLSGSDRAKKAKRGTTSCLYNAVLLAVLLLPSSSWASFPTEEADR